MSMQAHTGGSSSTPTNLQPSSRWRWVVSIISLTLYAWERHSAHSTGGCVELGATRNGTENLPPQCFNPLTAQSVLSHYTSYDLLAGI
jgi:hypothetical protein